MEIVIVEDERIAADRLKALIKSYDQSIDIVSCLHSITETVEYLTRHRHPDLFLMDIYLSDGLCFEIFKQTELKKPVIFTTAYDQYALDAFKTFSIDYIVKPVTLENLTMALNKYKNFQSLIPAKYSTLSEQWPNKDYKKRFLGKVGQRLFFIESVDIAFFAAENKIVYLVTNEGKRYIVDYTMETLQETLDPEIFFRANRSYLINIRGTLEVKPYFNNRLTIFMKGASTQDEIIIARERVAEFKIWAEGLR